MQPPYHTPLVDAFVAAGCELGYENGDYNGANQTRFSKAQATLRNGSRCSTGKAFAKPASSRSNLHISLESHVLKVRLLLLFILKKNESIIFFKDTDRS